MAFGGKMYHAVDTVLFENRHDGVEIADIGFDENVIRTVLDVFEIRQTPLFSDPLDLNKKDTGSQPVHTNF